MKKEKKSVRCNHPHYCYDWDSLFITPLMDEFQACTCTCDGKDWTRAEYARLLGHLEPVEKPYLVKWINELFK